MHITSLMVAFHITSLNVCGLRDQVKIHLLINNKSWDILCLQETRWDQAWADYFKSVSSDHLYISLGSIHSCGVATIVRARFPCVPKLVHTDTEGRLIVLDCDVPFKFRIINIYSPNNEQSKVVFFATVFSYVNDSSFIIGDFNTLLGKIDCGTNNVYKSDTGRTALINRIKTLNLTDIWRGLHGQKKGYSRRQLVKGVLKQSRIDLCLVTSKLVRMCESARYELNAFSDHSRLIIQVSEVSKSRNGGSWCLNNSLLEDELYVKKVSRLLDNLNEEMEFIDNIIDWWEMAKSRIKKATINFAKKKNWLQNQEEKSVREQLQVALDSSVTTPTNTVEPLILELKTKLYNMEAKKCKGAMIRARSRHTIEGERSTSYFLNLEKRVQKKVHINELKDSSGKLVRSADILNVAENFYSNLFSSEGCTEDAIALALQPITAQISQEEKELCDGPFFLNEVENAISSLGTNKSPGSDGLTGEFYKKI